MSVAAMCTLDACASIVLEIGVKRNRGDFERAEGKSKRRCVTFASSSFCKLIEPISSFCIDGSFRTENVSEKSVEGEHLDESSNPEVEALVVLIPTKTEDGPSRITLTTNTLIRLLVAQGTITTKQVAEALTAAHLNTDKQASATAATTEPTPESPPTPSSLPSSPSAETVDAASTDSNSDDHSDVSSISSSTSSNASSHPSASDGFETNLADLPLCEGVYARLRELSARIEAAGRAPLLPTTSVMGKEFLPALRFLRAAIRDAAAATLRRLDPAARGAAAPPAATTLATADVLGGGEC